MAPIRLALILILFVGFFLFAETANEKNNYGKPPRKPNTGRPAVQPPGRPQSG